MKFDRRRAVLFSALTLLFALTGPFGTYEHLNFVERVAYWALSVGGVGVIMGFAAHSLLEGELLHAVPRLLRALLASALAAIPGSGIVWALELWMRTAVVGAPDPVWLWLSITMIGWAVMFIHFRLWAPPAAPWTPFLKRLPGHVGKDLVSLSMSDHYVDVRTRDGSAMIHMRFQDALDELKAYPGLRIHRSHWVASSAAREIARDGARTSLVLDDGTALPVSKSYLPDVRKLLDDRAAEITS